MKKLLITGGGGFIGTNLIENLKNSYDITSISRNSEISGIKNLTADLSASDFKFLDNNYDAVIYLATVSSPKEAEIHPQRAYDTNVTVIQRFLDKANQTGVKKIILFSSAVLYSINENACKETDNLDQFSCIYNYSKYSMETLATYFRVKFGMNITTFRLSNTYGPGQNNLKAPYLIPGLFDQAFKNKSIEVWNTTPVRDWVFVDDVVKVVSKELELQGGGIFNLGTGDGRSVGELANIVSLLTKTPLRDLHKPVSPPYKVICDMSQLNLRLGYVPETRLEDGLEKSFKYYKTLYK